MSSDEALMLEFQRGSREAFVELFDRYYGPLCGFFRRRLLSQERAEELAQETFLVVIRAISRYEPRSLLRTYLYGIALKLLAEERRQRAKDFRVPETTPEPTTASVSDAVFWVRQALENLEPCEREVLMLREYEQLTYSEIAHLLRVPINTVRSRLFRARIALKERLQSGSRSRPGPRSQDENQGKPADVENEDARERSPATTLRAGKEGISQ